jgi:hypothetical protein
MSKVKIKNGNVMRLSDYYLGQLILICNWVKNNTETNHREHRRAIELVKRVKRFVYGTDRTSEINSLMKEEQERGVLFKD